MSSGEVLSTCFVMQPFDKGPFDKRFDDVLAPAIRASGLEPYRVDRDPSVQIPIQDIERGIREAQLCLAEITIDNPNVWFELGFAIAAGKEVILVCSSERIQRFPFDVQHRSIISYSTQSSSDFEQLKADVTEKIKARLGRIDTMAGVAALSPLSDVGGLDPFEIAALASIAERTDGSDDDAIAWDVKRSMESSGFTGLAASMAFRSLANKGLIKSENKYSTDHDQAYVALSLLQPGWDWLLGNKEKLQLRKPGRVEADADVDIPF